MNASEVKSMLRGVIAVDLDPFMETHGFKRSRQAMHYRRRVAAGTQELAIHFDCRPRYEPKALAHVLPSVRFCFPEVGRSLLEMIGGDVSLVSAPDVTFGSTIFNIAPKGNYAPWYVYDGQSAAKVVREARLFIDRWAIPFFADYARITDLTRGYETDDERLRAFGRVFYFRVAAAYLLLGMPDRAMQVLEERFGKLGPRRQYARIFEFVADRIEKARPT